MSKNKVGRPTMTDPRRINVEIRMNKEEFSKLESYSARHDISKAETLRRGFELLLETEKEN